MVESRPAVFLFILGLSHLGAQTFTPTGSMAEARTNHTATLLDNGKVLVTGGPSNTAEIYDPQSGTWRYTATTMATARSSHMAIKLANGRVLVFGGFIPCSSSPGCIIPTSTAEVFDSSTETFTLTGSLNQTHFAEPAFLLNDGRVIVVGGSLSGSQSEIYDPTLGTWSMNVPAITVGDTGSAAVKLASGDILATGGEMFCCAIFPNVSLYSPTADSAQIMAGLLAARANHTATLLPNGSVLIAGGVDSSFTLASTEIYNPTVTPNGQSQFGAFLSQSRRDHTATSLPNGDVLVIGGRQGVPGTTNTTLTSGELLNYQTGLWSLAGYMSIARYGHSATLLNNGAVLIAGGWPEAGPATNTAEIWGTPQTSTISVTTNVQSATFTIIGPATYTGAGTSFTQTNAPAGTYTITFGSVSGCSTPASQTSSLASGGTLTFNGNYQNCVGTINIQSNIPNARFTLSPSVPGAPSGGPFPITLNNVPIGTYQVRFNAVPGYVTPVLPALGVTPGAITVFTGTYVTSPNGAGTIQVSTNQTAASFTVSSPNITYSGSGIFFNTGVSAPAGTYTVTFSQIHGYYTPSPQDLTLSPGGTIQFSGTYRRVIVALFTGYRDSPNGSGLNHLYPGDVSYDPGYDLANYPGMVNLASELQLSTFFNGSLLPQVFTFYDSSQIASHPSNPEWFAPPDESDHIVAQQWIDGVAKPGPDDTIVIVGHSYGGNRARLFATQLGAHGYPVAALITIDPVDWMKCSIAPVLNLLCDQKYLVEAKPDNATDVLSFTQDMTMTYTLHGYHLWTNQFEAPYALLPYGFQELFYPQCGADILPFCAHFTIATDPSVHSQIVTFIQHLTTSAPQAISGVTATSITANSVQISWSTLQNSGGQVLFATDASLSHFYVAGNDVNGISETHTSTVSGLSPGQVYYYRVTSTPVGQTVPLYSSVKEFVTVASGTPVINATIPIFNDADPINPVLTLQLKNAGTVTASGCRVTKATVGTAVPSSPLPLPIPNVIPGGFVVQYIVFPGPLGPSGSLTSILVSGDCSGTPFSAALRARL